MDHIPDRPASRALVTLVGALAALTLLPATAAAQPAWTPPPDTVVAVRGTAADGFAVRHYDGSMLYPPTTSEAVAECGEYRGLRARVRCRVRARTWYRDLSGLQDSLRWASQRSARRG